MEPLKRLKVLPFATFQAFLGLLIGLLCGILYSFGGLIIDTVVSMGLLSPERMSTPGLSIGTLMAFGALLGMPLIFAGLGFLLGIVEAVLYNLYAKWFGGLRLDLY